MKYVVLSHNWPSAVLVANTNQVIANWVANSIPETYVRVLTPKNCKDYSLITSQWITDNCILLEEWINCATPIVNPPSDFLNAKQLAEQRSILFEALYSWAVWLHGKTNRFFLPEFPGLANQAVVNSDPENNQWGSWVLDYAAIHNLSPLESYRELKLIADSELSFRFRISALVEKWVNKISNTSFNDANFETKILEQLKTEFFLAKRI